MAPVRVARAFRLPIIAVMAAVALPGCTHTSGPVATVQPQGDLDSLAYGPAPPIVVASPSFADSGGAISALRASFAGPPPRYYAPAPVAYAAPMPASKIAALVGARLGTTASRPTANLTVVAAS